MGKPTLRQFEAFSHRALCAVAIVLVVLAIRRLQPAAHKPAEPRVFRSDFRGVTVREAFSRLSAAMDKKVVFDDSPADIQLMDSGTVDLRLDNVDFETAADAVSWKYWAEIEGDQIRVAEPRDLPVSIAVYDVQDLIDKWVKAPFPETLRPEGLGVLLSMAGSATGNLPPPVYPADSETRLKSELCDLITDVIEPESWEGGGGWQSVRPVGRALVVRATKHTQIRVEKLLADLREADAAY